MPPTPIKPFTNFRAKYAELRPLDNQAGPADDDLLSLLGQLREISPPPSPRASPRAGLPPAPTPPAFKAGTPAKFNPLQTTAPGRVSLEVALLNYSRAPTLDAYDDLHDAISFAWEEVRRTSTSKDSDLTFLKWLIVELEKDWLPRSPRLLVPSQYLRPLLGHFLEAASFACLDEVRYPQYTRHRSIALNRMRLVPDAAPPRDAMIPIGERLTTAQIRRFGQGIRRYRAAECMGFAVLAAATMLSGVFRGTLTIQTTGGHQFAEFTPENGVPIIIDLWLGSVGQPLFYSAANYPFAPLPVPRRVLFEETRK